MKLLITLFLISLLVGCSNPEETNAEPVNEPIPCGASLEEQQPGCTIMDGEEVCRFQPEL